MTIENAKVKPPVFLDLDRFNAEMGRRVQVRRTLLQLSVGALANLTQMPKDLIVEFEAGTTMMPAAAVYTMAKALRVDLSYFWTEAPQAPTVPLGSGPAKLQVVKG